VAASHHWGVGKNPTFTTQRFGSIHEPVTVVEVHVPLPHGGGKTVRGSAKDKKAAERAAAAAACDVLDAAGLLRKGGTRPGQ
jgi:dsRNA-specific ribonuclease